MNFKLNRKISRVILFILAVLAILSWTAVFASGDNELHIYFYDVGQGDAIYIRTPAGQDILIDGGPDSTILTKLGQDMPFYDRKIELIINTHPHADHITGLIEVLKRYEVDQILSTGVEHTTATFGKWKDTIQEKDIPLKMAQVGQKIKLGQASMYVLYPKNRLAGKEVKNLNDTSVVSRLIYGRNSALFTGDVEIEAEQDLLGSLVHLKSNILKVGHQGSKTSTSKTFLEVVDPEYAIISVGENKYVHPSEEILERLKNTELFRTDLDGDVECVLDGREISCQGS